MNDIPKDLSHWLGAEVSVLAKRDRPVGSFAVSVADAVQLGHEAFLRGVAFAALKTAVNDAIQTAIIDPADFITALATEINKANVDAGWWTDIETGEDVRNWPPKFYQLWVGTKLMLIVTEIAEGMEGLRKGLPDDKLPHRPMFRVELIDGLLRILDMLGGEQNDEHPAGIVFMEKRAYNLTRADHKVENRLKAGGKAI